MSCDRCKQNCRQGRACPYRQERKALPERTMLALLAALMLAIWLGWRWL